MSYLRGRDTPPAPSLPKQAATPTGELRGGLRPAAGSFVGYRVNETLIGIGLNAAVGRTGAVKGVAAVAGGRIVAAASRSRRGRCARTRRAVTRPCATAGWRPTATRGPASCSRRRRRSRRGSPPTAGSRLHGRTRPVKVRLQSRRDGAGVDLAGSTPIEFADYGMEPPSVAGVASVRDHGQMEVRLRLR